MFAAKANNSYIFPFINSWERGKIKFFLREISTHIGISLTHNLIKYLIFTHHNSSHARRELPNNVHYYHYGLILQILRIQAENLSLYVPTCTMC